MTNPTIADLLKYADLQMAAEAFLADKDTGALRTDLRDALILGNGHASRFTATQATHFLEHWKVVEQKPNTASGFSGTLFECTADDPATGAKRGDLVMSFRSTEFIDDSARDNQATNALEIKETGFAWGQVRDMEAWYQELVASGKLVNQVNPYKSFSVTGYSLGGHLASVFNEMHSNVADQVVTFNGAGIGGHTPDNTLSELIAEFASLADGNADGSSKFDFSDPYVGALFDSARTAVKAGGTMSVDDYARLSDYIQFRGLGPALLIEAVMLRKAVDRINDIRKEMIRLQSDIGLTQPAYTQVAQHDLDYQMAVLTMGKFTDAASLLGGLERAFGGKQYLTKQPNQFDIVGDTSPSAVANSQYHIGTDVRVFIEDQPLYRGSIGGAVAFQLLLYTGVKLLVNGYETKDFGDTHSLVLLVDSLNVQNTLLNMLPTTARATEAATVGAILKDASNLRAANGDLAVGEGQGKAEGDVLENTLNALADLVLGGQRFGNPGGAPDSEFTHLVGAEDGNLWWDTQPKVVDGKEVNSGRDRFYELLDEVQKSDFFTQANNGQLTLTLVPTANVFDLGQRARKDFGAYAALYSLSPFALLLGEGGISSDTNALLESAWGDVFKQWNADRELALGLPLSAGIPGGNVSDQWLSSRAELLKRKQYFNHANGDYISLSTTINLPSSASPFNGENIVWEDKSSKLKIQRGDVNDKTRYVIFGSDSADDVLSGEGNDDRLFGGAGDDQLSGGGGDDYLEGNSGNDLLSGGAGIDLLSGGTGNDTLSGGTGNDLLLGGSGNDELHGDDGKDFLNGGTGSDKLYGGEGNDYLFDEGGEETNTLKGDAGNDILEIKGGTGIALLDGGAGNDILIGGQGNNSLDGGAGNDSIQGGGDDDLINGGDDADYVDAGGGDDWIKGGKGADYLKGGAGSDTYVYDAPGFGVDLLEDNQGSNSLSFTEGSLGTATYDAAKMAWVAENGMEIRKYDLGGSTLLALGEAGDKLDTIYLRDWQPGQYGITLSGEETTRERPDVVAATLPTRAENNYVDLAYSDAADGGQGNDLLFGSAANSVLLGGSGNDIIDGAGGDDWLEGGEGTDFILTGSGRDVAYGGLGNDLIRAGGTFSMSRGTRAGTGEEVIFWDPSPSGFLYSDDETASQFYYYVNGQRFTAPHPELAAWDLEFTSNVYNSTNGPIRLWWSNADASNASLEPNLSIYLKVGDSQAVHRGDNLTAAPSADFGKAKSVVLSYGYGGEMLPPGTNAEGARLYGGGGDDVIYGANDNDKLYGEDDNDLLIGYDGDDELYGGKGKDELSGGAGRDFLDGGEGADLLVGGYGADVLAGGDGDDRLVGDAILLAGTTDYPPGMDKSLMGGDYLQGGAGNDMLWGNHGDDYLFGGADDDLVFGGEGDDHGFGEDGDDTLSGGQGGDFLDGGAGKDVLYGEGDGDLLLGGAGEDRLEGGDGDDILDGGADNDVLFGGSGQDNLRGGAGNDKLYGDGGEADDGADILEGGTGNDELFGGGKGDMYVFSKGDGQDVVNDDVADGSRNVIVFKFASDEVRMLERSGNDLLIKYGVDDQVTVKGYYGGSAFSLGSTGSGSGAGDGVEAESQPVVAEIRFEDGTVWGAEDIRALAPPPAPGELPPDPYAGLASIYFVNALLSREETRAAGKHSLSFSFANSFVPGVSGFREFDEAQKQAVREALSCFSAVLDLSFTELAEGAEADLTFHLDDLMSAGLGGAAGYAEPATGNIHLNSDIYAEQRLTELGELVTRGSLSAGNGGFEVLLHEIGHALGLKHPFEPPVLPNGENSTANTVMSYTSSGARATALAAFDVAALQYLYGVAPTVGSGNDVHTFGERWVQDSVGSDLFDASQETLAVSVDLTPGSWNFKGGKAASILADNQSFIGYGTVIENATGGTGNDTLIGNDAANLLLGGAGSDSLSGGLGDDTLAGGEGDDTLAGGAGSDLLQGGLGADTYAWGLGSGIDVVVDQSASSTEVDTLRIVGGLTPSDILLSRAGNDLVVRVRTGPESVTITGHYAGKGIERILFENGTQWDAVTIQANVTVGLTDADDYFQGTAAAETVDGRGGNDTIFGGGGNDTIIGGDGNDSLYGNDGDDELTGGAGNDDFVSSWGNDTYVFGRGDGVDKVEYGLRPDSTRIRLKAGVSPADLLVTTDTAFARDYKFTIAGTTDSLTLKKFLTWGSTDAYINQVSVEFADGTIWTGAEVLRRLYSGSPGSDYLVARPGGSAMSGGDGFDTLEGGVGNDTLDGGAGLDTLMGGAGDDTLINGETMDGGTGDDTYVVTSTSAEITDSGGSDVLLLPAGTSPSKAKVRSSLDYALILNYTLPSGSESTVYLKDYFTASSSGRIEQIRFADGTVWSLSDVVARANISNLTDASDVYDFYGFGWDEVIDAKGGNDVVYALGGNDLLDGGLGDDTLVGDEGNDTVIGGAGNDLIYGDDTWSNPSPTGNDRLDGGSGNDTLIGGKGDDTYLFGRQSDYDLVQEEAGNDRIVLDPGIAPADVTLYHDSDDLVIVLDGSRVQMRVASHFSTTGTSKKVESIVFADGTVWDEAYVASHAIGSPLVNTFTGASGNDSFVVDHTSDKIVEGANQGDDTVTSSTSYALPDNVENLTLTGLLNISARGNSLTNVIRGNVGDNLIYSDRGADTLIGGLGSDVYDITIGSYAMGGQGSTVTIVENQNEGVDTVRVDNYDYTLPENVENLIAVQTYIEKYTGNNVPIPRNLVGNAERNLIDGSGDRFASTRLDGGLGEDTLIGSARDNIYVVDNPGDVLIEMSGGGTDTVESSIDWTLASDFENLILKSGSGAIKGTGNAGKNMLVGTENSSANVLTGGLGDDVYVLGIGDAAVEDVGGGNDTVVLRTGIVGVYQIADFANIENLSLGTEMGASTLLGGAGADGLTGSGRGSVVDGGAGDDQLVDQPATPLSGSRYFEEEADTLIGGDGADVLTSRAGADRMEGGRGNDTFVINSYSSSSGQPSQWATVRFQQGDGADVLKGSRSAWISVAGWRLSNLTAQAQGSGYILKFGSGEDSITVESANQVIRLVFDDGVVVSEQGIASLVANQGSALGTAGADFLIGSDGASDSLAGLGGNDTIYGGGGNDVIDGGEGSDYLSGDDGNDEIHGGLGDDSILGAAGDDLLFGEGGVDTLSGGDGDDVLTGGVSAYGGAGNDIIYGTAGSDSLYGEGGNDSLNGGSGNDTLWGGVGNDTLQGGAGNDYLYGEAGDDVYLFGRGDGADTILGNFNGGYDELQLAAGIAPGEVSASRAGGADLLLSINGTSDSVLVKDFLNQASSLALIRFADGTTWTSDALIEQLSSIVGTSGADSLTGGSGHDKLRGLEGNDTLLGGAGRDTLDGGAGADRMLGGADNDKYIVDSTSDVVIEYAGEGDYDYIESSVTYTLPSNVEDLILVGTSNINATGNSLDNELDGNSGNNSLSGGAGHDLLFGNEGNDTLNGGTGDDSMWGGLGDDSYVVDAAPVWAADEQVAGDFIEEEEGEGIDSVSSSVAYALPANVENLTLTGSSGIAGTGNELANMLIGNSGANRISAGDGDDTLNGGSGADTLVGGRGDDSYVVDATGDVITEYANEGTDSVQASVSWTLGVNLENLTLTGASGLSGAGNALDNIIIGNGGANSLSGGAGNDTLDGGAGKDTLVGGAGNDTYVVDVSTDVVTENSNEGIDTVRSAVTWTLGTNLENLVLTGTSAINGTGNASNNMLTGNGANNTLTGGAGNDTLDGGAGTDSLVGGTGDDTYIVDATTDVVAENAGEGTDIVLSNVTWTLGSNVEHLTLTGSSSVNGTGNTLANMLTGNSGANTLAGAAGNDTLDGGAGNDTLNGGAGADTYMLGIGYGNDVIVDSDSTAGVTDVVRFGVGLTQSDIRFTQSGNALVATIKNSSESLTIQDWYLSAHNRVEEFRFDDGTVLTSVQAQALVGAMAAFNPTGPGIAMVNETSGQHMSRAAGIAVSGAA